MSDQQDRATFVVSPSSSSAGDPRELIARLRYQSRHFRDCLARNDMFGAARISADAQPVIVSLFVLFRNEQDYGRIADQAMTRPTFPIAERISSEARNAMIGANRLNPDHRRPTDAGIRTALNKLAHCDARNSTFRVEGDKHILLPSGPEQSANNGFWVIEVDIDQLCDELEAILNARP